MYKSIISGIVISSTILSAANVFADTAATIFADPTSTLVTYDNASGAYPIITAILSVGSQTVNGYTYSSSKFAFLAEDSTGSLDIYGALPSGTSFTPTVGDAISASGKYSPYQQIPEVGTLTSVTLQSSGNVAPSAVTAEVSSLNGATIAQSLAGHLIEVDNITISGQTTGETFGIGNLTLSMTDSSGSESFYYNPTSYSTANANLFGETIPTGPVDVIGIDSVYSGAGEFIPLEIVPVATPEPTVLSLCGGGALLAFVLRRKK